MAVGKLGRLFMPLPLRPLPIVEQWDCHCTGLCCHGTIINLSEADLAKLRQQRWDEHPDYRGQPIAVGHGLLKRRYTLAKRRDGTCIFLNAEGRCRIHAELGLEAKPWVCQMFPMQVIAGPDRAWVTLRRYCPSAAADLGRPVAEQLADVKRLVAEAHLAEQPARPPALVAGRHRAWGDVRWVTDVIERMLLDERFPPVRRLVHGLAFCDHLERCRLRRVKKDDFATLVSMLETMAMQDDRVADLFRLRAPPGRAAGLLFRQIALEYARLHPRYVIVSSWAERWRLVKMAWAFARGKGALPHVHECFPPATFEQLDAPLGHLEAAVMAPLTRYFEAAALSLQYCLLGRAGWSLVEGFRATALGYAVALWMLRWCSAGGGPTREHMIDAVGALDRGQSYDALCGRRHRSRVASLSRLGALPRLLVWYAR